jgi:hypothetical protein
MPTGIILTDCKIIVGGYNLSGYHNSISMEFGPEMLDDTRFGTTGTRSFKPGLKNFSVTGGGFWDYDIDEVLYNKIGAVREVLSLAHEGNVEGDRAFATRAVSGTYNPISGEVGALMPFELNFQNANSSLVRGTVLATGAQAASGQGTGVEIGAASATQRIYSALHVTAIAATSIDVIVESDDAAGFASPTTRLTHTQFTGAGTVGADWQELAGPITDTFWRSKWTIVGGPFTFFHVLGIQ